jgi:hypothetical protein
MIRRILAPLAALLALAGFSVGVGGTPAAGAASASNSGGFVGVPTGGAPESGFFSRYNAISISGSGPYVINFAGGQAPAQLTINPASGQSLQRGTTLDNLPGNGVDAANGSVQLSVNGKACDTATGLYTVQDVGSGGGAVNRFALFAYVFCNGGSAVTVNAWMNMPPGPIEGLTPGGVNPTEFTPITPTRVMDTRFGIGVRQGPLGAGERVEVQVAGGNGVPSNATAVVVNVTAINGGVPTYVTAYPAGGDVTTSTVNPLPFETLPNLAIVKLGSGGRLGAFNAAGSAHVLFDVAGYFAPGNSGARFRAITPTRIYDTRPLGAPFGPGELRGIRVSGTDVVPANATAVALNVTAEGASQETFVSVVPGNVSQPGASNLNPYSAAAAPNAVIVGVSGNFVNLYNGAGSVHLFVDVVGYFVVDRSSSQGRYVPLTPERTVNTLLPQWGGSIPGLQQRDFGIHGYIRRAADAPQPEMFPFELSAIVANATVTSTNTFGYLSVYPTAGGPPGASNLNWAPFQERANLVISGTDTWGYISAFNAAGNVDVLLDVAGYFTA